MTKNNHLKVSVITISYNQENYIKETLESIVSQKTDFSFEVIVADDGSSDKTKSIIEEYAIRYPHLFSNILRKKNIGAIANLKDAIVHAKGDYIALCEGDDFWTDVQKLQKQVNFMESHPDYAICFHPVRVFFEHGEEDDSIFPDRVRSFSIKSLLDRNFIQTNSVIYRAQKNYKKLATNVMPYDWYLHLYHAQFGKIGFINQIMSAYRRHPGGIWWSSTNEDKSKFWKTHGKGYIALYDELIKMYSSDEYRKIISRNTKKTYEQIKQYNNGVDIELVSMYPIATTAFINSLIDEHIEYEHNIEEIKMLRSRIVKTEDRLASIERSRIWRARNRLAKYIGRDRI